MQKLPPKLTPFLTALVILTTTISCGGQGKNIVDAAIGSEEDINVSLTPPPKNEIHDPKEKQNLVLHALYHLNHLKADSIPSIAKFIDDPNIGPAIEIGTNEEACQSGSINSSSQGEQLKPGDVISIQAPIITKLTNCQSNGKIFNGTTTGYPFSKIGEVNIGRSIKIEELTERKISDNEVSTLNGIINLAGNTPGESSNTIEHIELIMKIYPSRATTYSNSTTKLTSNHTDGNIRFSRKIHPEPITEEVVANDLKFSIGDMEFTIRGSSNYLVENKIYKFGTFEVFDKNSQIIGKIIYPTETPFQNIVTIETSELPPLTVEN